MPSHTYTYICPVSDHHPDCTFLIIDECARFDRKCIHGGHSLRLDLSRLLCVCDFVVCDDWKMLTEAIQERTATYDVQAGMRAVDICETIETGRQQAYSAGQILPALEDKFMAQHNAAVTKLGVELLDIIVRRIGMNVKCLMCARAFEPYTSEETCPECVMDRKNRISEEIEAAKNKKAVTA